MVRTNKGGLNLNMTPSPPKSPFFMICSIPAFQRCGPNICRSCKLWLFSAAKLPAIARAAVCKALSKLCENSGWILLAEIWKARGVGAIISCLGFHSIYSIPKKSLCFSANVIRWDPFWGIKQGKYIYVCICIYIYISIPLL